MHLTFKHVRQGLAAAAVAGVLLASLAVAQTAATQPAEHAMSADAAAVKKLLMQRFPGAQVANVSKSGYLGLYEAQFDGHETCATSFSAIRRPS